MINKHKPSIIIVTHSFSPGTSQALRDYCLRKKYHVLFIDHRLHASITDWFNGILDTFWQIISQRKSYDVYVGSNRLNAAIGVIFKKLNKVKKVIYFSPDWVEKRFNNQILNQFYQLLDYFCVKYADIIWNSSTKMPVDPMMQERRKRRYPREWEKKQIQVPDGSDFYPIPPFSIINRYEIGFVGHLKPSMGVQLAIDALPYITQVLPNTKLLVIGSGPFEVELKKMVSGRRVEFTGFMGDINKVYQRLSRCAIAIAPYIDSPENITQYSDPGKTKNYFSVGLPIIITKVPQIAYEIHKEKCGIAINYDKKEFADAVVHLLKSDLVLKQYRKNVLKLRMKYSWDGIFTEALKFTP